MECLKIEKRDAAFKETPSLNWGKVGVFSDGNITNETVTIMKENVSGKCLKVNDLYLTCPNNVLEEK